MSYPIIRNAPTPEEMGLSSRGRRATYPLDQMKLGQSIVRPLVEASALRRAAYAYQRRSNKKFTVRTISATQIGCWRVA